MERGSLSKLCSCCKTDKLLSEFRKQSSNKDGLKYVCKTCDDNKQRDLYLRNRENRIKQVVETRRKNKESIKKRRR
jgi:hypothetical protein